MEQWLVRAARARPQHPALGRMTYAQLLAAARCAAGGLGSARSAALAMAPGEDFAVTLHACLLTGVLAVPIDPRLTAAEQRRLAEGCDVVLDSRPDGAPADPVPLDLAAPAIVVHTSGTSDTPKRVELTYGNWLWSALGAHVALGLGPEERWLCALPLSHVAGLSILVSSVVYGTTAIVHEGFDPDRVVAEDHTIVSVVPTMLGRLLDAGATGLRALIGGAPVPPMLRQRAARAGVATADAYGLTETCSKVTVDGRPVFCARIELAADGEILVGGPVVAPSAGPWLRTGDLGVFDEEGRLRVTGRKADTIVTGGENVAPAEVEAALEAHPAVAEAGVHGRPDPEWGEAVHATVVLRDGASATAEDLQVFCREKLAPYKVPKSWSFATALPRTSSGKLLRRKLV